MTQLTGMKIKEDVLRATCAALQTTDFDLAVEMVAGLVERKEPGGTRGSSVFAIYEITLPPPKIEVVCHRLQELIDRHGYDFQFENRQLNFLLQQWRHPAG